MGNDSQAQQDWLKVLGITGFADSGAGGGTGRESVPQEEGQPAPGNAASPRPGQTKHAVTRQENSALLQEDPEKLAKEDLTQKDPKKLFTDEYMDGLVKMPPIQGTNDERMKDIMRKLGKGITPGERPKLIGELAKIRGVDAGKLDAEYDRFMVLRAQQDAIQKQKKGDGADVDAVPDLAEDIHDDFMGSKSQLLYGKVVGDAFGVDPVFGAMLNPTGGMVGPGNMALHMDDDDPTTYHGIVHDAAGYMFNYHDQGPGYDYLGKEAAKGHDTDNPLTGQEAGMRYWHEKMDPGIKTTLLSGLIDTVGDTYFAKDGKRLETLASGLGKTATDVATKVGEEVKVKAEKVLDSARKTVTSAVNKAVETGMGAVKTVTDTAKKVETAVEGAAKEAVAAAAAAANRVAQTASSALNTAKDAVGSVADAAKEKLSSAWDSIWS